MIDPAYAGVWRYWRSTPIAPDRAVTLGEPTTPLIPVTIDGGNALAKLDSMMPTGSFKDRGATILISFLKSQGVTQIVEDSSGNAAASMAGYAARAGIACEVYAPATASPGKLVQAAAYGAKVIRVEGTRDDVAHAAERAAQRPGNAYATHNWHPFFIEGVKTWAYEVWEQLGYHVPDVVIAPGGSGSVVLLMNDSQLVALNFLHFRSLGAGRTVRAIGCAGLTGGLVVGWAVNIASSRKGTTNRCAVIHVNVACVKTDTLGELSGTSSGI